MLKNSDQCQPRLLMLRLGFCKFLLDFAACFSMLRLLEGQDMNSSSCGAKMMRAATCSNDFNFFAHGGRPRSCDCPNFPQPATVNRSIEQRLQCVQ